MVVKAETGKGEREVTEESQEKGVDE